MLRFGCLLPGQLLQLRRAWPERVLQKVLSSLMSGQCHLWIEAIRCSAGNIAPWMRRARAGSPRAAAPDKYLLKLLVLRSGMIQAAGKEAHLHEERGPGDASKSRSPTVVQPQGRKGP